VKIEQGIKPPYHYGRKIPFPLHDMKVDDCLTVTYEEFNDIWPRRGLAASLATLKTCVYGYGKRHNRKYAVKTIPEEQIVRVWRTA